MPMSEFMGAKTGLDPRGYSVGRPAGPCIWIVIHTTDGSETKQSAEDGNSYDARRTDSVSTHVFVDSDSVVQEINSWNRAWAAREVANNRGYHVELCGKASQAATQWSDSSSFAELTLAAQHCARVCLKLGIPPKWLTQQDVLARRPGIITHANVSQWLEGTHTDPGPNFPFERFMIAVTGFYNLYSRPTPVPSVGEDSAMVIFQVNGDPALYKTDGVEAWHLKTMSEVKSLNALFGSTKLLDKFPEGITVVTNPVSIRGLMRDTEADDDGIRNEGH